MSYPASWQGMEQMTPVSFLASFLAPLQPGSQFRENMTLQVMALLTPATLDEFLQFNLQDIQQAQYKAETPRPCTLGDSPGYSCQYAGQMNPMIPIPLRFLGVFTIRGNRAYSLRYTARAEQYDTYSGTVDKMIASVHLL